MPHENFSQLFVIAPPVFLSLILKKSTDRGEQIGSRRWVHVKKFMRPRQVDRNEYQSGKSEMFDEMAILLP